MKRIEAIDLDFLIHYYTIFFYRFYDYNLRDDEVASLILSNWSK